MQSKTVLITGCSTGIGRDLAQRLSRTGDTVVATARHPEALANLQVALHLPLDVTDSGSITRAVEEVVRRFGRVDVLVNNAGYAACGALEELPDEQVREMFEVNMHGVTRMIRAVVPYMRRQGGGQIINISSIAGKIALPVNSTYSASKSAVEALSDALRLELAPFGIQVMIIEPGSVRTDFLATVEAHSGRILSNPASPYYALYRQHLQFADMMRGQEVEPQAVSQAIQCAIEARKPRARYRVGVRFPGTLLFYMGDRLKDSVLKRLFKIAPVIYVAPKGRGRGTSVPRIAAQEVRKSSGR